MKTKQKVVALGLLMLVAHSALGADGLYLGVSGGVMDHNESGYDNATNLGARIGYEFLNVGLGDLGVEGEFTGTVSDGTFPVAANWSVNTFSGFGVLRTAGPVYIKGRAGLTYWDLSTMGVSRDGVDFSYGLGLGISIGLAQLEFEYTKLGGDNNYYGVSLNLLTPF